MSESSKTAPIVVAIIGLIGVLGAAAIGNYDKLFRPTPQSPSTGAQRLLPPPVEQSTPTGPQSRSDPPRDLPPHAGGGGEGAQASSAEREVRAAYDSLDRDMERRGIAALLDRYSEDCEFGNDDDPKTTTHDVRQLMAGMLDQLKLVHATQSIPDVERAITFIAVQPDGSVTAEHTTRMTIRTTIRGRASDETKFEHGVDRWEKRGEHWLIVKTTKLA